MAPCPSHNWVEHSRKTMKDGTVWVYEMCSNCKQVRSHVEF